MDAENDLRMRIERLEEQLAAVQKDVDEKGELLHQITDLINALFKNNRTVWSWLDGLAGQDLEILEFIALAVDSDAEAGTKDRMHGIFQRILDTKAGLSESAEARDGHR